MSNLIKHAQKEFRAAGWTDDNGVFNDDMQEAICNHLLELLKVFDDEGHSGSTAPYTINLFSRLAKFEPIAPLTGEDWEWNDTGRNFQNKRASHVFKDYDGQAYDINGRVFWEWSRGYETGEPYKSYYTCRESHLPITFPYTVPKEPEYVYRYSDAEPPAPPQTEAGLL
jgi:hypothetical protein